MISLDDNMANVFVYSAAMAADILANWRTSSPNILRSYVAQFYTNNYCTIIEM